MKNISDQEKGGTITIPDGYFVRHVDFDADPPICIIQNHGFPVVEETLEIPRSLAYYLTVHHNGSNNFREQLRTDAQNELRSKLKDILSIKVLKNA